MSDVLERICADTRAAVARAKSARPLAQVEREAAAAAPPRGFADRLAAAVAAGRYGLIAEIKKASPSQGLIRPDFDPAALARAYRDGGAICLSVLTDAPYFQGDPAHLKAARAAVDLPVLRKDFMLDPWQIAEARAMGADCVLIIMAALDDASARDLAKRAAGYGMDVLVEVHDAAELDRALALPSRLIGVNNRNLKTLKTDLSITEALAKSVPRDRLLVAESGLETPADLARMARVGAHCFLVGTSLMSQRDVAAATRALLAPAA
ncbi:MAG TPA: indole-3-glycerol phosphate synthase TrpC [Alphaproteobacteria bacterium]|nr:indole-3-glycerol phosphate synthase TrpC [Alphaproteobacteria bacterium]